MERPEKSPTKIIYNNNFNHQKYSLGFTIGLSISITIIFAYYCKYINLL